MIRFAVAALALVLLSGASVLAQTVKNPKVQVFGGYSLLHADHGGLTASTVNTELGQPVGAFGLTSNYSGWNAEVQYNLNHWLGAVADFSGHYGNLFITSNTLLTELPRSNQYSLMFGPVLTYKTLWKVTPFVHALGGMDRQHQDAGSIPGLFGSSAYVTDWAVAVAAGGGIDYKVFPHMSVRLGQFDYLYTGHDLNAFYNDAFGRGLFKNLASHENNLRFSTGILIKF
jgi:opacity protein-like surface antigen